MVVLGFLVFLYSYACIQMSQLLRLKHQVEVDSQPRLAFVWVGGGIYPQAIRVGGWRMCWANTCSSFYQFV